MPRGPAMRASAAVGQAGQGGGAPVPAPATGGGARGMARWSGSDKERQS